MFHFFKTSKTPDKYDDIDWHGDEGVSESQGVHIAFMFIWLADRGHITPQIGLEALDAAIAKRQQKPSEVLEFFADGKLLSSMIDASGVRFLNNFYESGYLPAIEASNILALDHGEGEAPYNITDSWKNVDIVFDYLDQHYAVRLHRK